MQPIRRPVSLQSRVRSVRFWENASFGLLALLHLGPVWACRYFLTADGPAHLYNAALLKDLLSTPTHFAHQLLAVNFNPEPNYLSHALLAGLLTVLPPWLAEKAVLTLYLAGFPLALRYLLRAVHPEAGWLAILVFPLIYNALLVWGFYNFCLSVVLLMLVLGYWLRWQHRGRPVGIVGLAGLITLLYTANPLTYLVSGLLLGLLAVAQSHQRGAAALARQLGWLLLAHLPTLPLLGWYLWHKGTATSAPAQDYGFNLWNWLRFEPISYLGTSEGTYRWLVSGVFALALFGAVRQFRQWPGQWAQVGPWAVGTLLLLGAYVLLPDAMSGGSVIRPRWGLMSYLTLLAGIGATTVAPRWRAMLLGVGSIVAVLFLVFRWQKFNALQSGLAEYNSVAPFLRPGATLLPLVYAPVSTMPNGKGFGTYIGMFAHAAGYVCTEKNVFNYENYEASTGYFPLTWRPGCEPLLPSEAMPLRLAPFLFHPSHAPTYLLLWGRKVEPPTSAANAAQIAGYMARFGYQLRYTSPTGLLELYQLPLNQPFTAPAQK